MSDGEARFDERMRGIFAGVDTSRDFDLRVMQRVAVLGTAPIGDLRAQFERRRERTLRKFRREAWSNSVTITGIGAAAMVVVWHNAPAIVQWAQSGEAATVPWLVAGAAIAALTGGLWNLLRGRSAF